MPIMIKTQMEQDGAGMAERKMSVQNVVKANITHNDLIAEAIDLIEEDMNTTQVGNSEDSSDEETV